ncbi:hypothetical protein BGZ63DRAFT_415526 [Mariannaea sp. PMI_226]|nr:hypothetical protein BGZ63DRAFT_415526 [Mariannaea sp. PMI_226]
MANLFTLPDSSPRLLSSGIEALSVSDFVLLPLVLLGSAFVINRGSILPRSDPYYYKWFERPQTTLVRNVQTEIRSRNISDLAKTNSADLVIFWGSQSGTAEGFAHRLAREVHRRLNLKSIVADLQDFDPETITRITTSTLLVFIVSTFGEGDPSDNAQHFMSWLQDTKKSEGLASMEHLKFAAFGCGNSNYRYYNKTVEGIIDGMRKCGATQLCHTGRGDEATRTTEEDFTEWKDTFFSTLVSQLGVAEVERGYEPLVAVVEDPSLSSDQLQLGPPLSKGHRGQAKSRDTVSVPVIANRILAQYPSKTRACIEVTVDLSEHAHVKYKTGDHIAVWPENSTEEVSRLLSMLGLEDKYTTPIRISQLSDHDDAKVPALTTIGALFRFYLEICSPIPRETVQILAKMAPTTSTRTALQQISQDRRAYSEFLQNNYLTLSRLLEYTCSIDSSTCWKSLPLPFIIDILPTMQPRLYSIASSRITSPRHVSITVAVKPSELSSDSMISIPGLCSTHLSVIKASSNINAEQPRIHVQIKPSKFKLPVNISIPLVMVAAGTGIAPFYAFLQERTRLRSIGRDVGPMILFFGCQNDNDYLYREQLDTLANGSLAGKLEIVTAFSRSGDKKTYVQDTIKQRQRDVFRLLKDKEAALYICGSATMAKAVGNVLTKAAMDITGWPESQANDWMVNKKRSNRWFEDVWS